METSLAAIWMEIPTTLKAYPVQRATLYRLLDSAAVECREIKSASGKRGRKLVNVVSLRAYLESKGRIAATPPVVRWLEECWRSPRFVKLIQKLCQELSGSWHLHFELPKQGREAIVLSPDDLLARRPNFQFFEVLHAKCVGRFERRVSARLRTILDDSAARTSRIVAGFKSFPAEGDTPRVYCACLTRVLFQEELTQAYVTKLHRKLHPDAPPRHEKSFAEMDLLAAVPEDDTRDARLALAELLDHPSVTPEERRLIELHLNGHTFEDIADNSQAYGFPPDYPASITGVRRHLNRLIKKLREIHLHGF